MRKLLLETKRLLMVTTTEEDLHFFAQKIYGDFEVVRHTTKRVFTKAETEAFMHKMFTYDSPLGFAPIIEKRSQKLIGHGGILPFKYFQKANHYEFGYIFQKSSWGQGYASEIAQAQIESIQTTYPNAKIFATVSPANKISQHILEKVGMERREKITLSRGVRLLYALAETSKC